MAFVQVSMKVSPPTYNAVTAIKKRIEEDYERTVSYSEVIDNLVRVWNELRPAEAAELPLPAHVKHLEGQ
jgi:hypothetical protein